MRALFRGLASAVLAATVALGASQGCVIVTGSTDGYSLEAGNASACDAGAPLVVPPAPIGDSGATTTDCVACVRTECRDQAAVCEADCPCRDEVLRFFACIGSGATIAACSQSDGGATINANLISLASCFQVSACARSACGQVD